MIHFRERFFPPDVVSEEEIQKLREQSKKKFYRKGNFVLARNDVQESVIYVNSGCLRQFVVDTRGREHVLRFAPQSWLIGDFESLTKNTPAETCIDAIEDSEVFLIPKDVMYHLQSTNIGLLRHHNNVLRNAAYELDRRIVQLLSATAEERYLLFLKTYPDLVNRIPLKMIASYMGVTPESLSRVRHALVKKPKT